MIGDLEEEQEIRRERVDTWLDTGVDTWLGQTSTCNLPTSLPNPFNLSLLQEAYIYSSEVRTRNIHCMSYNHCIISYQVEPLWEEMKKRLESAFCHPEHGPGLVRQMQMLVDSGLKWDALGIILPGIKEENMVATNKMTKEQQEVLSSLYLAPSQHTALTWDLDVVRAPASPLNPTNDQVALARDGILKVEDWGLPEDLLVELSKIAKLLLTSATTTYFPDLQARSIYKTLAPRPKNPQLCFGKS